MSKPSTEQQITDYILSHWEDNKLPWKPAYKTDGRAISIPLRHNNIEYRGINCIILLTSAIVQGFTSPSWITFKQCQALGGNVKGQKGTRIIKYGTGEKESNIEGEDPKKYSYLRKYSVFNISQCADLPDDYIQSRTVAMECEHTLHDYAKALGVKILHGHNQGAYYPEMDTIRMPNLQDYTNEDAYAMTLAHELIHCTGHKSRLDRDLDQEDKEVKALEELNAELGATILLMRLGIPAQIDERVIPYIKSWLNALHNDPKYLLKAAANAQKAVDCIMDSIKVEQTEEEAA